jgi:hypothetical protein
MHRGGNWVKGGGAGRWLPGSRVQVFAAQRVPLAWASGDVLCGVGRRGGGAGVLGLRCYAISLHLGACLRLLRGGAVFFCVDCTKPTPSTVPFVVEGVYIWRVVICCDMGLV